MYLYLDNYRGFTSQLVKTNHLNILVGENSTGKTSFLSILSLLSSPEFLFRGKFKNRYVDLGSFEEIANSFSGDKQIRVGIIKDSSSTSTLDSNLIFDGVFLIFDQKDGYPYVKETVYLNNDSILKIKTNDLQNGFAYELMKANNRKQNGIEACIKEVLSGGQKSSKMIDEGVVSPDNKFESIYSQIFFWPFITIIAMAQRNKKEKIYKDFTVSFSKLMTIGGLLPATTYMAPIRTKPERIYQVDDIDYSAEGGHTPGLLRDIYKNNKSDKFSNVIDQLEKFGQRSGLYERISISNFSNSELSPFEIYLEMNNRNLKITNVGYGVSQILPILTQLLIEEESSVFLIQQPEVHLHPRSQAFFGEFIFDQLSIKNRNFFIETHSDYVIDRIRMNVKKQKGINDRITILFFESNADGNKITAIDLQEDGELKDGFPKAYREFFLQEQFDYLGL